MKKYLFLFVTMLIAQVSLAQWNMTFTGVTADLYDIHFADENTGYAVGMGGTIIKTTDGGTTWNTCLGVMEDLYMVYAKDEMNVYAGGTKLWHSTDGGITWVDAGFAYPKKIAFTTVENGYMVDAEGIYYTNDGGETWTISHDPGGTTILQDVDWNKGVNGSTPYCNAMGNVSGAMSYSIMGFRTNDKGEWFPLNVYNFPNAYGYSAAVFPSEDTSLVFNVEYVNWMPGNNRQLVRMSNFKLEEVIPGEMLWNFTCEIINDDIPGLVTGAWFANTNEGWISTREGIIYHTTDGGVTWNEAWLGIESLKSLCFVNEDRAYAAGAMGTVLAMNTTTGMDEKAPQLSITVSPVPAKETLYIKGLERGGKMSVYSLTGALVYQEEAQNTQAEISVSQWRAGTYIMQYTDANGRSLQKKLFVSK